MKYTYSDHFINHKGGGRMEISKKKGLSFLGFVFLLFVGLAAVFAFAPGRTAYADSNADAAATGVHTDHDGWTAITSEGGGLTSGKYYLTGDTILSKDLSVPTGETVTICLNGYKLTGTGSGSVIYSKAALLLCDCQAESTAQEHQHAYYVAENGLWTFYDGKLPSSAPADAATGTVTGGVITGGSAVNGGGLLCESLGAQLIMEGCTVAGNFATYHGGGAYLLGTASITDTTFAGNVSQNYGGGCYFYNAEAEINNITVESNVSQNYGGGFCLFDHTTLICNGGTFSKNAVQQGGGGLYSISSVFLQLSDSVFAENSAGSGGAAYLEKGSAVLNRCQFADNTAASLGGGLFITNKTTASEKTTLNDCVFTGNSVYNPEINEALLSGGGIYLYNADLLVNGGEMTSNEAYMGGAMYLSAASVCVTDGTIKDNNPESGRPDLYMATGAVLDIFGGYWGENSILQPFGVLTVYGGFFADKNDPIFNALAPGYEKKQLSEDSDSDYEYAVVGQASLLCESGIFDTPLNETGGRLESGTYYLADDLRLKEDLLIDGGVKICLNGHKLTGTGNGSVFTVNEGASLTICDCKGESSHRYYVDADGEYVFYEDGQTIPADCVTGTLEGGVVTGGSAEYGGGISVLKGGYCSVEGGIFAGNSAGYEGKDIYAEQYAYLVLKNGSFDPDDISAESGFCITGGYFSQAPDQSLLAESAFVLQIDAALGDPHYTEEFPYAVYLKGQTVTASANAEAPVADGNPVRAGEDFTLSGVASGAEIAYSYKTDGGDYVAGLPSEAGEYTVRVAVFDSGTFSSAEFSLSIAEKTETQPSGEDSGEDSGEKSGGCNAAALCGLAPAGAAALLCAVCLIRRKKQS